MTRTNYFPDVLETTEAERLATGFKFLEGPTWHPDDYWYFVAPPREQAASLDSRQAAEGRAGEDDRRRNRHDLRSAGPPHSVRSDRPARLSHRCQRQGRDAGRQVQGRAPQFSRRCDLSLQRLSLFHRSGLPAPL